MNIPVVLGSDDNLIFALATAIVSLLENAKSDTFYEIHCLLTDDVTDESKAKLTRLQEKYKNCTISLHDMKDKFRDIPTSEGYHVNYVSAYKMLVPSLFPQYNKVLYLDTDTLIRGDLSPFYNIDMQDNYLCGVPSVCHHINNSNRNDVLTLVKLPSIDFYINAGVILMNLKEIREHNIDKQWIELLGAYKNSVDQHILNKVCYGHITFAPLKYNVCQSGLPYYQNKSVQRFEAMKSAKEAVENPVIFHWSGKAKPWKYNDRMLSHEWFRYFLKTGFDYTILSREKYQQEQSVFVAIPNKTIKYRFLGIPLWKIRIKKEAKKHYLFSFIKIFTQRL